MTSTYHRRPDCRGCHGTNLDLVLPLAPTPVGEAYIPEKALSQPQPVYPLDLFLCRTCGLAQVLDVVDPEVLYGNFIYTTSISLGLAEHFKQYVNDLLRYTAAPTGSFVVDIGSNDGTFLRFFQERGMRVLGIDPARETARKATAAGIETLPVLFTPEVAERIRRERGPARIVTANHTFANIDDIDTFVEGVRQLLAPEGVFVLETGYHLGLLQNRLVDNIYHEHLSYFSVQSLEPFFRRHGMQIVDASHPPIKGGCLRCTVQLLGGPLPVAPSVASLRAIETERRIDQPDSFKPFQAALEKATSELQTLLRKLKDSGKTVAGYGASVGVTTLLYRFKLQGLLAYLVDDNPAKHGLYSPGYHLPVLPSQALYEKKPDCVLILAWRYAGNILDKHQAYLQQGGKFIIPLPELRTVEKKRGLTVQLLKRLGHICLGTTDLHRAMAFYCDLLGCRVVHEFRNQQGELYGVFLAVNHGTFLEFFLDQSPKPAGGAFRHLCFEVEDIQQVAAYLTKHQAAPSEIRRGRTDRVLQCWIQDPDGNQVEFHQYDKETVFYSAACQ